MTPRSQLQPGQGITPEPKLNEEAEFWECNEYVPVWVVIV